jgi:competence protein ComEC
MVLWSIVYFLGHLVATDVLAMHWTLRTIVGGVVVWFIGIRSRRALTAMVLAGVMVGVPAWSSSHDVDTGDFAGVALVVEEPVHVGASRVVLSIETKRYVAYLYSRIAGAFSQCRVGDQIRLEGVRSALSPTQHGRLAPRHVVGVVEIRTVLSSCTAGSAVSRSVNGVRDVLASSVDSLDHDEAALLLGLVIGDDSDQPRSMVEAFRAAGLSHLTAVSGQNVAFVLAVFAPLLRRTSSRLRLGVMVGIVAWFVVLTRCEPSVVRAGVMAVVAGYGSSRGFESSGERALSITVIGALLVDPLLGSSVGFALSTSATAGLVWIAPRISSRIAGPRWFAEMLGVTIGAQLAVMPVSWFVFRSFNLIGLVSNLAAVPVAGFVMLCGLPVMGVCGTLVTLGVPFADELTALAMLALRAGVRWVWWVAAIAASL